jgi:hypothetical protein
MASGKKLGIFLLKPRVLLLLLSSLMVIHTVQANIVHAADKNTAMTARQVKKLDKGMKAVLDQVMNSNAEAQALAASGTLCAIGVIPGPATSFNIRFGLFNVIDNSLDHAVIDSFEALGGEALLHQSVFAPAAPPSGTLTVEYPTGTSGKGPVVLSFTSFDLLESAALNTDPDTYDNPDFGATVKEMDGTEVDLIYDAATPGSLRCEGTFIFDSKQNASIAYITQQFP